MSRREKNYPLVNLYDNLGFKFTTHFKNILWFVKFNITYIFKITNEH